MVVRLQKRLQLKFIPFDYSLHLVLFAACYLFTLLSPGCAPLLGLNLPHFSKPVLPDEFRDGF